MYRTTQNIQTTHQANAQAQQYSTHKAHAVLLSTLIKCSIQSPGEKPEGVTKRKKNWLFFLKPRMTMWKSMRMKKQFKTWGPFVHTDRNIVPVITN